MAERLKILLVTNSVLQKENSAGNTWQNLFDGMPNVEIANIYCRAGKPNVTICDSFFQISEKQLLKNLLNRNVPSGKVVDISAEDQSAVVDTLSATQSKWYDFARKHRFMIFFWLRELIWLIGRWKSRELKEFVDDFEPDLIMTFMCNFSYHHRLLLFLSDYADVPLFGFFGDDVYTLKQFSLSPLYWIDRFNSRYWIKKTVNKCTQIFVASALQKAMYDAIFHKNCRVLYKGAKFSAPPTRKVSNNTVIQLVFTGNVAMGRSVSLGFIGRALDDINGPQKRAELHIYSQTPLNNTMKNLFDSCNSIVFHGGITFDEVLEKQQNADILVHVESFNLRQRLITRLSFSTKLVDYFRAAKCILAVGWAGAASIDYLKQQDAAVVVTSEQEAKQKLEALINDHSSIERYAQKAWECGMRNHQIEHIQRDLYHDLVDSLGWTDHA